MTVTVTVAIAVSPRGSADVIVYVVVWVGETIIDPVGGTSPMPWLISHVLLLTELQLSIVSSPRLMVTGFAESVTDGLTTVTVTLVWT
jgi:hypothetical protein